MQEDINAPKRDEAIDLLRGLVMVIMVLDHARDFWGGFTPDPNDLAVTNETLFFTRWVTNLCAPVFVFLAGASAYLYGQRHGNRHLSLFLLSRGIWLIILELTLCKFAWIPEPGYQLALLQVIWAIGCTMIVLAVLCQLKPLSVGLIGLTIVIGHNLLDPLTPADFGAAATLWILAHEGGSLALPGGVTWLVSYPFIPWIGVISLGYSFAASLNLPKRQRNRLTLAIGLTLIGLFVVLRALNLYGDPVPWSAQASHSFTLMSFLNVTKYPPSLLFLLMTLGPALCLLAWLDNWTSAGRLRNMLLVFGRVPLFFYIAHLYLLRFSALPVSFALFGAETVTPPPGPAGSAMLGLGATYIAWLVALALLYPACRRFAAVKQRRQDWWLRYL